MSSQPTVPEAGTALTPASVRAAVMAAVTGVAPELTEDDLTDDARMREDLDLDSMDVLDVMTDLGRATGVEIPEADQARLRTIGDCVAFVVAHTEGG